MTHASIIVPVWNGRQYLRDCFDSVLAQDTVEFEIIAVDNASVDGSADLIEEQYGTTITLIRNDRNRGFAGACNQGISAARGEILITLNQDTRVRPGWLSGLTQILDVDEVGVAGCKVLFPDERTLQHAGGKIEWPQGFGNHHGYGQQDDGRLDRVQDVDYVTGASCALRREVVDEIGAFDERFWPGYYEDVDFCFRARDAGWRVVYTPDATVIHEETTSLQRGSVSHLRAFHRGRLRFLFKHRALHALEEEFVPAEIAWLRSYPPIERSAVRSAYRDMLHEVSQFFSQRKDVRRAGRLLEHLHSATDPDIPAELSGPDERNSESIPELADVDTSPSAIDSMGGTWHLSETILDDMAQEQRRLEDKYTLSEHVFRSELPVVGPLIARFRDLWNRIATKWYVQPLVQQQNEFNYLLVHQLERIRQQQDALYEWQKSYHEDTLSLHKQQMALYEQQKRLYARLVEVDRAQAQTIFEMTDIAQRLAQIDDSLQALADQIQQNEVESDEGSET